MVIICVYQTLFPREPVIHPKRATIHRNLPVKITLWVYNFPA
jgi:hypothetical protein